MGCLTQKFEFVCFQELMYNELCCYLTVFFGGYQEKSLPITLFRSGAMSSLTVQGECGKIIDVVRSNYVC
jgi:hypothetical protein